ncbi:hypothetical protein [Brevibacterium sp. CT2-23B]|uniref:hypothetical protein n=1 Tax=Brevibacterium sp. CT2-23B TaxID=2729630 RepID=UPI0015580552|nr:hypothetical protein [Brevibacterium sp. CT2-23B]
MSEKYTPDEVELAHCYAGAMEEQAGENYDEAKADAERGIAKIKADALREAAKQFGPGQITGLFRSPYDYASIWLKERADRIEEEA